VLGYATGYVLKVLVTGPRFKCKEGQHGLGRETTKRRKRKERARGASTRTSPTKNATKKWGRTPAKEKKHDQRDTGNGIEASKKKKIWIPISRGKTRRGVWKSRRDLSTTGRKH